mmetsp:Transcript_6279/g.21047  ORF Transcript_6279/g.21047 Transcript_6279/m.21047 type:complete len:440 (-) Transcript_6279:803-2122(-)
MRGASVGRFGSRTAVPLSLRDGDLRWGQQMNTTSHVAVEVGGQPMWFDVSSIQGHRPHMEDRWSAHFSPEQDAAVYCVFDGHGGKQVSEHLSRCFAESLLAHPRLTEAPAEALKEVCLSEDERMLQKDGAAWVRGAVPVARQNPNMINAYGAGSTGIILLVLGPMLYVANVGDSRCVIGNKNGDVLLASLDQRPSLRAERERVEALGGFVRAGMDGLKRTCGILAVSRAFGDQGLKRWVRAEAAVQQCPASDVGFVILASDGVTDVLGSPEIAGIVKNRTRRTGRRVAHALVHLAKMRHSQDNITALVLIFGRPEDEEVAGEGPVPRLATTLPSSLGTRPSAGAGVNSPPSPSRTGPPPGSPLRRRPFPAPAHAPSPAGSLSPVRGLRAGAGGPATTAAAGVESPPPLSPVRKAARPLVSRSTAASTSPYAAPVRHTIG